MCVIPITCPTLNLAQKVLVIAFINVVDYQTFASAMR